MARLRLRKTSDNEQWEKLEDFQGILNRSISLHRNGQTPVAMTEDSLYNLLSAEKSDFLEITVAKVAPVSPINAKIQRPLSTSLTPLSPTNSQLRRSLLPKIITGGSNTSPSIAGSTARPLVIQERPRSHIARDTKIFLPVPNTVCGNCQRAGHTVRDCVGPVDEDGEIDGCPRCNTARSHRYDDCPQRDPKDDFDLIYRYRQRKPPIRSLMSWQSFLSGQHHQLTTTGSSWPRFIPWSAGYALERQELAFRAHRQPEWVYYEYDRIGWPEAEAHYREVDPESEFLVL